VNLLDLPLFQVVFKDGTQKNLTALEAIRHAESIYELVDTPRQNLCSVRFLSTVVARFGIKEPAKARFDTSFGIDHDLEELMEEPEWFRSNGKKKIFTDVATHIIDQVASGADPGFQRGVTKPLDDLPTAVCACCVGKALLRRTLFTPGCGGGNAAWVYPDTIYAHPLGSTLWETLLLCKCTPSPRLWWESDDLATEGEAFGMSFAPNRFMFDWITGDCYLCGIHGKVTTTLEKITMLSSLVRDRIAKHQEPMLLGVPWGKSARTHLEDFTPKGFPKKALPESGRFIRDALERGHKRFYYSYLNIDYRTILSDEGGVIDLDQQDAIAEDEPTPVQDNWVLYRFMDAVYRLTPKQLDAVKDGDFTSPLAMSAIPSTIWRYQRSPLKMLLLRLYANYPVRGYHTPDLTAANDYLSVVQKCKHARTPLNWRYIASVLSTKL
jgi:hypothetical protein